MGGARGSLHGNMGTRVPYNAFDKDARRFISVCSNEGVILNNKQREALDYLCKQLKGAGIWNRCLAIYPMIGGAARTHKYNLKDPRDVNAAYRITWTGENIGFTHTNNNGFDPQSGVSYGTTNFNPSITDRNNFHQGAYLSDFIETSGTDMGVLSGNNVWLRAGFAGYNCNLGGNTLQVNPSGNTGGKGFCIDFSSGGNHYGYLDTLSMGSTAITSGALPNSTSYDIGRLGLFGQVSNRYFKYVTLGYGITPNQAVLYRNIVTQYQKILGRA